MTIVHSLLDVVAEEARQRGAIRVARISCRIGCLRQVDDSLLHEAFEIAKRDSLVSDAVLDTTYVGMQLTCHDCAHSVRLDGWSLECPACESPNVELSGGDELELTSLELEVPDGD